MFIQYTLSTGFINAAVSSSVAPENLPDDRGQIAIPDGTEIEGMMVDTTQIPPILISMST